MPRATSRVQRMQQAFDELLAMGVVGQASGSMLAFWQVIGIDAHQTVALPEERRNVFVDPETPDAVWGADSTFFDDDYDGGGRHTEMREVVVSPAVYVASIPLQVWLPARHAEFLLSSRSALAIDSMYRLLGSGYSAAVRDEFEAYRREKETYARR